MPVAYFDCFAGISGDMILGALLDLGLNLDELRDQLQLLPVQGYRLEAIRTDKRGIQATQFRVLLQTPSGEQLADAEFEEAEPEERAGTVSSEQPHAHPAHPEHRSFLQIRRLIEDSLLSSSVKERAIAIFDRLAEAEARVHGGSKEEVHFHEIGGVDAIVDIVGAAIGLELLGIRAVHASPLHLGSGFIRIQHGLYPVPAPATANLLSGVPSYTTQAKGELVTPTGAAIITTIADSFGPMPAMRPGAVGYGAGTRDREFPNVLRVFLGELMESPATDMPPAAKRPPRSPFPEQHAAKPGPAGYHESQALVVEANIDDMNPQFFEVLVERLMEAGALDVVLIPVYMKKNRPGVLLQVLVYPPSLDDLLEIIFTESTSIGARTYEVTKRMLQREDVEVETPFGSIRAKISRLGDRVVNISPEYEDCRKLALKRRVPVKEVYAAALAAAQALVSGQ